MMHIHSYVILLSWIIVLHSCHCAANVLIYVPIHKPTWVSMRRFYRAAFSHRPSSTIPVDICVLISGVNRTLKSSSLEGVRQVFLKKRGIINHVDAENHPEWGGLYDRSRSQKGWVQGPNRVFYASMMTRNHDKYKFILQMEMDVATLKKGWLDDIVNAMPEEAVVSGAQLEAGDCIAEPKNGACSMLSTQPKWIRGHINGNALFRVGPRLTELLQASTTHYPDWPFDLAIYHAATEILKCVPGCLHKNELMRNVPFYVDKDFFTDPAYWGRRPVFVHVPFHLRRNSYEAAIQRLSKEWPVSQIFISSSHADYLQGLLASTPIQNMLWVAFDEESYDMIVSSTDAAHHPCIYRKFNVGLKQQGSARFKSDAYKAVTVQKSIITEQLYASGFDVFVLDLDVVVLRDYLPYLAAMPKDRMYFSLDSIGGRSFDFYGESQGRYFFNVGVYYIPQQVRDAALRFFAEWNRMKEKVGEEQDALNILVRCASTAHGACQSNGLRIDVLPPELFVNGANFFIKHWPHAAYAQAHAFVVHNNWADGYDVKMYRYQARMPEVFPPVSHCEGVVQLRLPDGSDDAGRLPLGGAHSWTSLQIFSSFVHRIVADYVDSNSSSATNTATAASATSLCVAMPSFLLIELHVELTFDMVFDFYAVQKMLKGIRMLPSAEYAGRGAKVVHIDAAAVIAGGDSPMMDLLPICVNIDQALQWILNLLPTPVVCVHDFGRSSGEVGFAALGGGLPALANAVHHRSGKKAVFLAGRWRLFAQELASLGIFTSMKDGVFPKHMRQSFGYVTQYGQWGEDGLHDLLDAMICMKAHKILPLDRSVYPPPMDAGELMQQVARFIPPDILAEDLGIFRSFSPAKQEALLSRRLLFAAEKLERCGLSNRLGALQSLLYLSSKNNMTCVMPAYLAIHSSNIPAPWGSILNQRKLFAEFDNLLPASLLLLLRPRVVLEYLKPNDAVLPLVASASSDGSVEEIFRQYREELEVLKRRVESADAYPHAKYFVTFDSEEHERLLMKGLYSFRPSHNYLGMDDTELARFFGGVSAEADMALPIAFRSFRFDNRKSEHRAFEEKWQRGVKPTKEIESKIMDIRSRIGERFVCAHIRVLDEYLVTQRPKWAHSSKESVMKYLVDFIGKHDLPIYISADVDMQSWADAFNAEKKRSFPVLTCHVWGCSGNELERSEIGFVESRLCAAAEVFAGNIYSSFTLQICGLRHDQLCHDMFGGRTIGDNRLLFG